MKILFVYIFCFFTVFVYAGEVDTVETFSPSMNKKIKAVVITPLNYHASKTPFPVVYVLHGHSGNYSAYIKAIPELQEYADKFNLIIVTPDGDYNSWYLDSPADDKVRYETYISKELINWIDSRYKTIKDRKGRGITGLSMGGHGAMYLSFKHQDIYGVAGSMSGGVDFRPFPNNWQLAKKLGSYKDNPERWNQNTVINMIDLLKPGSLDLIIDCGTEDFFFTVNNNFHQKLLENKIPHDYIVRPGAHAWPYWKNAIVYQLTFMSRYFTRTDK